MLKKCIGIVSYFPDDIKVRSRRIGRFNELLTSINELWPTLDIVVISQNWKDYRIPETVSNVKIIKSFEEPLGIIKARNLLREELLKTDYNYVIMLDDDARIQCNSPEIAKAYLDALDEHPDGFCFIHSADHWHTMDDYARAPLNLCAISRNIYSKEPLPEVSLENNEALEDDVYAVLLHIKYGDFEFNPPEGIYHVHNIRNQYMKQYTDPRVIPSTWYNLGRRTDFGLICRNTQRILDYIVEHKDINLEEIKKNDWEEPRWH